MNVGLLREWEIHVLLYSEFKFFSGPSSMVYEFLYLREVNGYLRNAS
jgi:hypothetical protein